MRKKKSFWSGLKLRAQLFRIWFMKNIVVWIQIFCISCVIAMLTGNITSETPILGTFIYPIFKPLVDEIIAIIAEKSIDGLMDFFAVSISLLISIGLFTLKVRNIAQSDIKSEKLKIAMVQANLYFNSDGKLVQRTERLTGVDIDGDGKVDNVVSAPLRRGLLSGIGTAIEEFKVIATADLSGTEEENLQTYKKTLSATGLEKSEKALKELDGVAAVGIINMVLDASIQEVDKRKNKISTDKNLNKKEKVEKLKLFSKIKKALQNIKDSKQKVENVPVEKIKEEVIVNSMDKDSSTNNSSGNFITQLFGGINEKTEERKSEKKKTEKTKVESQEEKKAKVQQAKVTSQQREIESMLNNLRNG